MRMNVGLPAQISVSSFKISPREEAGKERNSHADKSYFCFATRLLLGSIFLWWDWELSHDFYARLLVSNGMAAVAVVFASWIITDS